MLIGKSSSVEDPKPIDVLQKQTLGGLEFQLPAYKSRSTSTTSKWTTAAAIALFGLASTAQPAFSQAGPKNLVSPTYRAPAAQATAPKELTKREVKRLAATAESRADHLKIAGYYKAQADKLEAQALGYEVAAATYRNGPFVKNLMAPTTPGRYEFAAKNFRDEAKSDRGLAASHEREATVAKLY
jgi:hypothetical protein